MSDEKKTAKGFAPKTFKDAGTGEIFEGGKEHPFTPGAHLNYRKAGLITDGPKAEAAAADKAKAA